MTKKRQYHEHSGKRHVWKREMFYRKKCILCGIVRPTGDKKIAEPQKRKRGARS